MAPRRRLDAELVRRGLARSRAHAGELLAAGRVLLAGQEATKAATQGDPAVAILVRELPGEPDYVSRGGHKLAGALDAFAANGLAVPGRHCLDAGASTGGFTDVLLQRGAARVYAIDVGQGQLDWKLRQDARVVVLERTNARYVESLPEPVELVVIDVSFISLRIILPAVAQWLGPAADVIALIKPQFEAGPESVGKGGIVRDAAVRRRVLEDVLGWAAAHGWGVGGLVRSSLVGGDGNVEYLVWLRPGGESADLGGLINSVE